MLQPRSCVSHQRLAIRGCIVHAYGRISRSMRHTHVAAAAKPGDGIGKGGGQEDALLTHLSRMADKYILGAASQGPALSRNRGSRTSLPMQGIHILLSCMLATWLLAGAGMLGGAPLFPAKMLVLDHMHGLSRWWTLLTDAFVSPSIQLLARNVFFGYMFGRSIQNTDGGAAVWTTWFMSALGGSIAALVLLPKRAALQGCACTAALFGLFAAATLFNRHKSWHWQRVFELAVLLPFVLQQLLSSHNSLSSHHVLGWLHMPGCWVPLAGGLVGTAAATGMLSVGRALASSAAQQRQREVADKARQPEEAGGDLTPVSVLLAQAAAQLLTRGLRR